MISHHLAGRISKNGFLEFNLPICVAAKPSPKCHWVELFRSLDDNILNHLACGSLRQIIKIENKNKFTEDFMSLFEEFKNGGETYFMANVCKTKLHS